MSPENVCPRFKQNAWKKELCSNCFRPKEEHPEKPKRVHVDYKPLPEISPAQSILKVNGSCDKSRKVSFSIVETEVIGYGGEEYSTDEEYSSDEENGSEFIDSGDDEELKRLTEANTNLNSKPDIVSEKVVVGSNVAKNAIVAVTDNKSPVKKPMVQNKSTPLVTIQPFCGESPKSLVFNFLKNKEIATVATSAAPVATVATCEEVQKIEKKDTENVQLRKTETTKKPTLTRSSLVANSNEPYLNIRRCSLPAEEEEAKPTPPPPTSMLTLTNTEIPRAKLVHQPETVAPVEKLNGVEETTEVVLSTRESDVDVAGGGTAPYKTRNNVPRMGTMHFKLKLAVASSQKPEPLKPINSSAPVDPPQDSSLLTSREMAGEPDGKADSDEPGDPTTTTVNRSFLHNFKDHSLPLRDTSTTPPRTPTKKTSITSNSPPECPRSIKRQAPKPPPPPPSLTMAKSAELAYHSANSSFSDDEFKPDNVTITNRKLLAEYCEQIEKEQSQNCGSGGNCERPSSAATVTSNGDPVRESSTLPLPGKRPACEKKKYGKATKVGLKIKKFLRIPSRESTVASPQQPSTRPKLEIIHPLDINKSGVEIIHNYAVDGLLYTKEPSTKALSNHHPARPTKPPPPPRSLPPVTKLPLKSVPSTEIADYPDAPKTCDSSASDETYEPVNFSAPECDHSSPEMARLTSMQYYGSETESDIYPTIQFGDDFGAEDSIRNTQPGHKSLEESYDAVVIANHEALTKLLDQATSCPKVPKELAVLKTRSLEWSSFHVDPTSRLQKAGCAFYNSKWYDVPVVLSISGEPVELNIVLNNHFTMTKVTEFVTCVEKEYSPGPENEKVYVTLWNAHHMEAIESYCKEYNAKYADITKEAGLILVETVNLLIGLQASDVNRYSLEPFVVTRNCFGADPTVAMVQLETDLQEAKDTLCDIMLKVLRLLAPTWEMTVCLSQVLRQDRPNSLSKCKALLEFWLWGPTGVTVSPDRPLSLKRWLDLERANVLHGHVCSRSADLSVKQICYMSFLVVNDDKLFSDAWTVLADRKMRPPRDPTISKC
ncbi:verprolin [Melanaphis sacchari]|uniref:verprolin n=1 Tax=Melanaphis sacchari TaxID=742174 RepID=UPI000DC14291|nr:verprolin [Melanaphis sacchari]